MKSPESTKSRTQKVEASNYPGGEGESGQPPVSTGEKTVQQTKKSELRGYGQMPRGRVPVFAPFLTQARGSLGNKAHPAREEVDRAQGMEVEEREEG